jgi:uncharacterized protein YbdZ (MbtH family)
MSETKAIRISSVKYLDRFKLRLRWVNGIATTVDLREPLSRLKGLKPLRDESVFATAKKDEGGHSVVWPGDLDMGADRLWEMALEQQGRQDALEFFRWRWRYGLSLSDAAEALGISRRQLAYHASGKHVVPRTVLLACKGWEAEQKVA